MAAMKRSPIFAVLLICFLLVGSEMTMRKVEGQICYKPSATFKGLCGFDRDCNKVCKREGNPSGQCYRFKCRCRKKC